MSAEGSTRAVVAAFAANLGIAISKFVGYAFTGSSSMLAEGIHSVADTGNEGLLLLGGFLAAKPATLRHPFGNGRERYFWSFVVALVLFSLGSLFAIVEGIEKILHPEELESVGWALAILGVAFVLESLSLRTGITESNRVRGRLPWARFVHRTKNPELPVVLLEDAGALAGLLMASTALVLSEVTGNTRWDGVGTLGIGLLLGGVAITLAIETKSLLIGEGAVPEQRDALVRAIEGSPEVVRLIHLRTQHLGPEQLLVAAKIELRSDYSMPDVAAAIDRVEERMREAVPIAELIFLEPDVYR